VGKLKNREKRTKKSEGTVSNCQVCDNQLDCQKEGDAVPNGTVWIRVQKELGSRQSKRSCPSQRKAYDERVSAGISQPRDPQGMGKTEEAKTVPRGGHVRKGTGRQIGGGEIWKKPGKKGPRPGTPRPAVPEREPDLVRGKVNKDVEPVARARRAAGAP